MVTHPVYAWILMSAILIVFMAMLQYYVNVSLSLNLRILMFHKENPCLCYFYGLSRYRCNLGTCCISVENYYYVQNV